MWLILYKRDLRMNSETPAPDLNSIAIFYSRPFAFSFSVIFYPHSNVSKLSGFSRCVGWIKRSTLVDPLRLIHPTKKLNLLALPLIHKHVIRTLWQG